MNKAFVASHTSGLYSLFSLQSGKSWTQNISLSANQCWVHIR